MFIFETNNTAIKFLIDTTLFNNCSNTENGGCISYSQEGEFIQDRICSYDSRVEDQDDIGVYCFIDVTNTSEFKNFIHDSSITKSGYEDYYATGFGNVLLQNGKIQIKSINISFAQVMRDDFYIVSSYLAQSRTSFSTFFNATSMTLHHISCKETFELVNCNILEVYYGSVCGVHYATVHVKNCSILRCVTFYYFLNFNSEIIIDGCYIDISNPYIYETANFTNNVTSYFTHNLSHFSSAFCYAENPIIYPIQQKNN